MTILDKSEDQTSLSPRRSTLLREPLIQFLLIGAALFVLYRMVNDREMGVPREIVVSATQIAALNENFSRTWLRRPSPEETRDLINDYVREEVFYREAIAMGLDRDDTVVRRRLRQKMEFVAEDLTQARTPTDAELTSFLADHRERFLEPPRVSFEQVYFSTERRGAAASQDAEGALGMLQSGLMAVGQGDPTLLPPNMLDASREDVARALGEDFATQLEAVPLHQWTGPLRSTFGLHLVRVTTRDAGALPSLASVRPTVLRDWQAEQAHRRNDEFYRTLLRKYAVRIESGTGLKK